MLKKLTLLTLKVFVSGGLLWLAVSRLDLSSAFDDLLDLSPALIFVGLSVTLLWVWLSSLRWSILMRQFLKEDLSVAAATSLYFVGLFFHQLVFTIVGGDAVRAWGAYVRGVSLRNAVVGVALDRLIGFIGLALLILLGLPILAQITNNGMAVGAVFFVVCALITGTAVLLIMDRFVKWLPQVRPIRGIAGIAIEGRRLLRERIVLVILLSMSILGHTLIVLLAIPLAHQLNVPMTFGIALAIIPAVTLLSSLPISFAGWGVRESAMAGGFALVGFDPTSGIALSILLGLLQLSASLPGALIWMSIFRRRRTDFSKFESKLNATEMS